MGLKLTLCIVVFLAFAVTFITSTLPELKETNLTTVFYEGSDDLDLKAPTPDLNQSSNQSKNITNEVKNITNEVSLSYEYTPNTRTRCFFDECTKELYSGIRFVKNSSNQWTEIEKADSLLNAQGIELIITEDEDEKIKTEKIEYPIEVIDFNYTSVQLKLYVENDTKDALSLSNTKVPLRMYNKNQPPLSVKKYEYQ
jgi:hypothetical protein